MKLPEIEIVKPKIWDLVALIVLGASAVLIGANMMVASASSESGSISGTATAVFVLLQLALCFVAFLVLGKTASVGTLWGNLLSLGAGLSGMSGVLMATTLWAIA